MSSSLLRRFERALGRGSDEPTGSRATGEARGEHSGARESEARGGARERGEARGATLGARESEARRKAGEWGEDGGAMSGARSTSERDAGERGGALAQGREREAHASRVCGGAEVAPHSDMSEGTCPKVVERRDPWVSGVYVLWSRRAKPAAPRPAALARDLPPRREVAAQVPVAIGERATAGAPARGRDERAGDSWPGDGASAGEARGSRASELAKLREERDPRAGELAKLREREPLAGELARLRERDPRAGELAKLGEQTSRVGEPAKLGEQDRRTGELAKLQEQGPRAGELAKLREERAPRAGELAKLGEQDPWTGGPGKLRARAPRAGELAKLQGPRAGELAKLQGPRASESLKSSGERSPDASLTHLSRLSVGAEPEPPPAPTLWRRIAQFSGEPPVLPRGDAGPGFVREVTRWSGARARPPMLAGAGLELPDCAAWRAAWRCLFGHVFEDMSERAAFLDVEATGLGHGAGTVAFLIGLATPTADGWQVEQWLLSRLGAEAEMLADLSARLVALGGPLVTYNGASFDLPLLRGRLRRCGLSTEVLARPHLDLLPVARRLWRGRGPDCRLVTLERSQLGVWREGDIAGRAIPEVFWTALRRPHEPRAREAVRRVVGHNLVDVLTMPALAGVMARTLMAPGDPELARRAADHRNAIGRRLRALGVAVAPPDAGAGVGEAESVATSGSPIAARTAAAGPLRRVAHPGA